MRITKGYLYGLLILISSSAAAQVGTTEVYFGKKLRAKVIKADSAFIAPTDTTNYKTGFVVIGSTAYIGNGVKWTAIGSGGGGGSVAWGSITGGLEDQTDLVTALGAKLDESDTASLSDRINLKMDKADTVRNGSATLAADFTTSSTTAVSTNLTFAIGAYETYVVSIFGTASKATSTSGMKLAIAAPSGCTIKGLAQQGGGTLSTALTNSLITAINTLGSTFATGNGVEVGFRWEFRVINGATPGNITLQGATVTSNTATIYAGSSMIWHKTNLL